MNAEVAEVPVKRTYLLPSSLLIELEAVAKQERRPIGSQLAVFLEESLVRYKESKQKPAGA